MNRTYTQLTNTNNIQIQYLNPEYSDVVKTKEKRQKKERIAAGDAVISEATSTYHSKTFR